MEIEKKMLLSGKPEGLIDGTEIRQGYITTGDPEVRVRSKAGKKFFLTRKGGEGFVRSEEEIEISKEIFELLWPTTAGKRVEKTRYALTAEDGLVWEIDEYAGDLKGLFSAEVELPSETTQYVVPAEVAKVFVADVTIDKRYKNKKLATDGLPS
jgi:CYTH domain-containing protein